MALVIAGIEKFFAGTAVLKDVSLSIEDGAFLTLVGPKGSGKSTLLRILAGRETADVGSFEMVSDTGRMQYDPRIVSSKNLVAEATVRENLEAPLRERDLSWYQKLPKVGSFIAPDAHWSISSKVRSAAVTLRIDSLLGRRAGELSDSQKQRVAIAQAMVSDPAAYLFDDPFSDLDPKTRSRLRAELFELHHMLGVTMIYATNDPSEALKMPDRLAVMLEGRIAQAGPPDAVYDDPDTLAVAQFTGTPSINLLPGELSADGRLSVFGRVLARYRNVIAKPVTVGMRPEAISLSAVNKTRLNGRVCHSETTRTKTHLHVEVAGQRICVLVDNSSRSVCVGETVFLAVDPVKLLLFEADGRRLRLPMLQSDIERMADHNPTLSKSFVTSRSA